MHSTTTTTLTSGAITAATLCASHHSSSSDATSTMKHDDGDASSKPLRSRLYIAVQLSSPTTVLMLSTTFNRY
ncbi:hypothetical protein LshimejAT787_4100050 [Lyophyllum shimeji]|uniref:Uncharacterized protein n=1 Tax=Lyophyllum shimeji TaxID=47721 RepID=A0A9P3UVA3_LYOSH|nr:hypothetical protein LshimejAT787_1402650 [Lyophyllum shimeji]GLB45942.1 hypothetical protein LshimejAT787_4100050 [Lyophyllum shimeji]